MENILILGAGAAQVPLIQTAQAMGLHTVVATIPGNYPGIAAADEVSYTDISDPEAITRLARELHAAGIVTCCFETGLHALAHACQALSLPGITPEAAEISVNKLAMKRAFDGGGVRSAQYRLLQSMDDLPGAIEALGFPMVVKAVDLQGSSGVYVVHDRDQASQALAQSLALTHEDYCIAEAFITGDNIGAEAFIQNNRLLFILPDGTVSYHGRTNIPIGHYAPLDCGELGQRRICREVEKAVRACGFDNCAVNVDLILHDGEPYIVELTARAGATCLPELVSIYYGVNYYKMLLLAALGRDASAEFDTRRAVPQPNASSMLGVEASGVIRAVSLPEPLPEGVYDLHLIVKPGDAVHRFEGTIDRVGQLIVTGDTAAACLQRIDELRARIRIEVEEHG